MYTALYSYVYTYTCILHYTVLLRMYTALCTYNKKKKNTHTFIHMHVFTVPYTCICMDACNAVYVNLDRGGKDGAR